MRGKETIQPRGWGATSIIQEAAHAHTRTRVIYAYLSACSCTHTQRHRHKGMPVCVHANTHTHHKQTYAGKCAPTHPSPMRSPFRVGAQGQVFDRHIPALSPPPVETHLSITGGCKGLKTWAEEGLGSREVRRDAIPAGMPRLQAMAPLLFRLSQLPGELLPSPRTGDEAQKWGPAMAWGGEAPCSRLCPGLRCKLKHFPFLHNYFF